MGRRRNPWFGVGMDSWALGVDAASVITLRMMKFAAGGPAAAVEAERMVSEKIEAGRQLQVLAMTGQLGFAAAPAAAKTVKHYRRKVAANRRRLTRG